MPAGRPSKYRPEFCEQAKKLVALGATDLQLANFFEVSEQTIYTWKQNYPEFLEALKLSKELCDSQVERSLFQRAMGYSHPEVKVFQSNGEIITHEVIKHYPPDTTAMIFWLKNRNPQEWRDRVEHTGKDGGAIEITDINEVDMARKIAFVLAQGAEQCQKH